MSAFLRYTLSRMALFLTAAVLVSLMGLDALWTILIALVISSIASIFLLRNQREALSSAVVTRAEQRRREQGVDRAPGDYKPE